MFSFRDVSSLLTARLSNQNALGGSISRDTFQDASGFEDSVLEQQDNWQPWPIVATDGDTAALVQLVSEDRVCNTKKKLLAWTHDRR